MNEGMTCMQIIKEECNKDLFVYEAAYRRGYLHGYDSAMDDMQKVSEITEKNYNKVLKFFNNVLSPWRYKNHKGKQSLPPTFKGKI